MALFTNPPESKMTEAHAYLDPGSSVSGKLEFEGPALIYGHIEGEIDATDVVMIGEGAVLTAQVKAASVLIVGAARGRRSSFRRDLPRARRSQGRGFWGATAGGDSQEGRPEPICKLTSRGYADDEALEVTKGLDSKVRT